MNQMKTSLTLLLVNMKLILTRYGLPTQVLIGVTIFSSYKVNDFRGCCILVPVCCKIKCLNYLFCWKNGPTICGSSNSTRTQARRTQLPFLICVLGICWV